MAENNVDYEVVQDVDFELSVQSLPVLIDNREAFFGSLNNKLDFYRNLEFTEETVKEGKATLATLNNAKKIIDAKRISVKKELMKPYEEVEKFCKEAQEKIDEVARPIKSQLEVFEQKRIEEKKQKINDCFEETLKGLETPNMVNFVRNCKFIYNPLWENASYTMSKIKAEIQSAVSKILNDIEVLKVTLTDDSFKILALDNYKVTGDAAQTIKVYTDLVASAKQTETELSPVEPEPTAEDVTEKTEKKAEATEELFFCKFECTVTGEQFRAILSFLHENNIHGKVSRNSL